MRISQMRTSASKTHCGLGHNQLRTPLTLCLQLALGRWGGLVVAIVLLSPLPAVFAQSGAEQAEVNAAENQQTKPLAPKPGATKPDAAKHKPTTSSQPEQVTQRGEVAFLALKNEDQLPARYQLKSHRFTYTRTPHRSVPGAVDISLVRFPSPVETPHPLNNEVHCEFFQPLDAKGKPLSSTPGVIVLHILGGDFELARAFCMALVRRGSSALFLKMPYYGPRRTAGVPRRMISEDPAETVEGMTQAILDIRRATAWLGAQETVDEQRLGVFGISLGGITGALATGVEPRLHNTCLLLAGGDVARIVWQSNETRRAREAWLAKGRTREEFEKIVSEVDPVHLAARARGRRILMLNAKQDKVVPPEATKALWNAFDQPPIVWYEGGHYSVARHFFDAIKRVGDFYAKAEASPALGSSAREKPSQQ